MSSGGYWLSDYGRDRIALPWLIRGLSVALFFVAWEIIGRSGRFFAIVPATTAIERLWEDLDLLWQASLGTLRVAALGFLLALVAGVAVGSMVGLSRVGRIAIDPLINIGVVTPMTMLIPVIGIYVGLGFRGKVFFIFMFVFFVISINTAVGVAEVPAPLRETARAFGVHGWGMYRKLVFPNALPYILTGVRLGAGRAIQGAIIADLLLEVSNLGRYLIVAGSRFDMPALLAGTFFTVMLATAVMLIARYLEHRSLRWLTM